MTDLDRLAARFDHLVLGPIKRGVVIYSCPVCGRRQRDDGTGMEPACTGPRWTDDHPLTIMKKMTVDLERTR